jgi:hypothetical protein
MPNFSSILDRSPVEQIALERLRLNVQHVIDRNEMLCLESARLSMMDDVCRSMVLRMEGYILGREGNPERYVKASERIPATWWDAVKERWLERWGWTVKRRTIEARVELRSWKVCPHMRVPEGDAVHLRWFISDGMGVQS